MRIQIIKMNSFYSQSRFSILNFDVPDGHLEYSESSRLLHICNFPKKYSSHSFFFAQISYNTYSSPKASALDYLNRI